MFIFTLLHLLASTIFLCVIFSIVYDHFDLPINRFLFCLFCYLGFLLFGFTTLGSISYFLL